MTPSHQVESMNCTRPLPTYRMCHGSEFKASLRQAPVPARPNRQVGGGGGKYPHPHQVQSCHVMTHIITPRAILQFKSWLNKQTVLADHVLCLSDSYSTWHIYFRNLKIQIKISQFSDSCTEGCCWRAERAASTWPATHFRPLSAVQTGLFLSSCKQFTPKSGWFWRDGGLNGVHIGP